MIDENQVIQLLTEIRDMGAANARKYDEYLNEYLRDNKEAYIDHIRSAVKHTRIQRAFDWAALFVIIYLAVYLAIQSAK